MGVSKYKIGDVLWQWYIDEDFGPELLSYTLKEIEPQPNGRICYRTEEAKMGRYCTTLLFEDDNKLFPSAEDALLDLLQEAKDTGAPGCTMDEIYILCMETILNKLKPKEPDNGRIQNQRSEDKGTNF